jgi:AraC-like DNA-binding protein
MNAPLFFLSVDIAIIVCNALFGARVLARHPRLLSAQLIALITFDTICYVVLSRYEYRYWIPEPYWFQVGGLATLLNFARNLTPGLFMILCFTMFADRLRFPRWLLGLFLVEMFLEVPMRWLISGGAAADMATRVVPAMLQAVFVGFALYWTIANWRSDLIQSRRRARALTIIIIGLNIIGSTLFLRVLIPQNGVANYYSHLALTLSNLPIVLFILVFLSDEDLRGPLDAEARAGSRAPASAPASASGSVVPAVSPEIAAVLGRLRSLMEIEHVYRRPDLSVKELADLVQTPEYRLRKIIHEQLGYANFNVFLHHYRIREACQQLRDPALRRIPILTIALSTGYQSINTFNRGFREILDMTPSAYRALDEGQLPPVPGKISPESA